MKKAAIFLSVTAAAVTTFAQFGKSPFTLRVSAAGDKDADAVEVRVALDIPADHLIYEESFAVTTGEGYRLETVSQPEAQQKPDLIDPSVMVQAFTQSFEAVYRLTPAAEGAPVTVAYQGCDKSVCFMPESHVFRLDRSAFAFVSGAAAPAEGPPGDDALWLQGGRLLTAGGYMSAADFLAFLDKAEGAAQGRHSGFKMFLDDPVSFLKTHGVFLTLILVLAGGVLLNLTPCVLPMIPINLAIIGAGTGTRGKGFARGSAYGAGIVMVYGGLGWVILRLGIFFGAIQSNPWFNLVIGIVFAVLSLALFDLFIIDFTRFMSSGTGADRNKGLAAALAAGAVSALLAGACVAPVVIAVLLLAGNLYAGGMTAAQFLPFVLGAGMALPWPFAGAGLSVLPSPGMWMVRVKQAFGVFMILLALYYFSLAGSGFFGGQVAREGSILAGDRDAWLAKV
jgi:thioredoxin:protein disulfide reductase